MKRTTRSFYELHPDQARSLVDSQLADGWTRAEIINYWRCLDYDVFFLQSVIQSYLDSKLGTLSPLN